MESKRIGTHDGKFHADEALACYMLWQLPAYKDAQIVRTRDAALLGELDIVVDVGAEYDPKRHRYDHHQRTFKETWSPNHSTPLSSAGLVYRHFGKELIQILGERQDLSPEDLELVFQKIYTDFVEGIDGVDNGVPIYSIGNAIDRKEPTDEPTLPPKKRPLESTAEQATASVPKAAYSVRSLSAIVDALNPLFEHETANDQFVKAVEFIGQDFRRAVYYLVKRWLPARQVVHSALGHCRDWDEQGRILVLHAAEPWKSHVLELEPEFGVRVEYVLFPESHSTRWMIQAVPLSDAEQYQNRRSFPPHWRGLRDAALSDLLTIPGCVFVHNSGFIAANETFDGAMSMAKLALEG